MDEARPRKIAGGVAFREIGKLHLPIEQTAVVARVGDPAPEETPLLARQVSAGAKRRAVAQPPHDTDAPRGTHLERAIAIAEGIGIAVAIGRNVRPFLGESI